MSAQRLLQFDSTKGRVARDRGKGAAAAKHNEMLELARSTARRIALERDAVTADDIYLRLTSEGKDPTELGNAAGSIFNPSEWEFTGEMRRSRRVSNHGRRIMVWRLR